MIYIPSTALNVIEVNVNLHHIYPGIELTLQVPQNIPYLVLDSSSTLIGFNEEPIKHGKFYHPQPGTDFIVLGQLYDEESKTLPLLPTSYLLNSTHS